MILEILANIGLSMQMFLRGTPADDKVNSNIKCLKSKDWFRHLYEQNEGFFLRDEDVRYLLGWTNVDKVLKNEKKADRLKKKILYILSNKH